MKSASIIAGSLAVASQYLGALAHSPSRIPLSPNKVVRAQSATQTPSQAPVVGGMTCQGCYSSKANMTSGDVKDTAVSSGSCREYCLDKGFYLIALNGQNCYCGYAMPPADTVVKDSECDFPCPAYPDEACGGIGSPSHYTIFNIGITVDPPVYKKKEPKPSSSTEAEPSSTSSEAPPEESTPAPAETSTESESDSDGGSSTNVAGIAGGVVAGVVLAAAAVGGLWFFMRRRRNSEIEEEQRRNAAVNAFISGSKPPGSSGSISMTDSRLDPVMAHRRLSDGSIADNEDYSRKILRVRDDRLIRCDPDDFPKLTKPQVTNA